MTFTTSYALKDSQRFKLKAGVFLFLIQNGQILLLRRYQTGIDDGLYVVPMGAHDGKEPLTSSLIREAKEEANVILKPEDITVCHTMHRLHTMPDGFSFEQIDLFFKAEVYEGIIENMEPHKCDDLRFFPIDNLPNNIVPFIHQAIRCLESNVCYSEFGWL
jgi:8-oxo-dGTP pyrophosphatase MutT (NUDIX family)